MGSAQTSKVFTGNASEPLLRQYNPYMQTIIQTLELLARCRRRICWPVLWEYVCPLIAGSGLWYSFSIHRVLFTEFWDFCTLPIVSWGAILMWDAWIINHTQSWHVNKLKDQIYAGNVSASVVSASLYRTETLSLSTRCLCKHTSLSVFDYMKANGALDIRTIRIVYVYRLGFFIGRASPTLLCWFHITMKWFAQAFVCLCCTYHLACRSLNKNILSCYCIETEPAYVLYGAWMYEKRTLCICLPSGAFLLSYRSCPCLLSDCDH